RSVSRLQRTGEQLLLRSRKLRSAMRARLRLLALPMAVMTVALWSSSREAATQSSAPQYGVTLLGTLGVFSRAVALGITPDAAFPHVVGYSPNSDGDDHAFSGNPFGLIDL